MFLDGPQFFPAKERTPFGERFECRHSFVATYGAAAPGTLVALIGSSGWLELAVVNGNAAKLGVSVGDWIHVSW